MTPDTARAVNRLLNALLELDDHDEQQLRDDAARLADHAHRVLGSGLTGAQIRSVWTLPGDPRPIVDVHLP